MEQVKVSELKVGDLISVECRSYFQIQSMKTMSNGDIRLVMGCKFKADPNMIFMCVRKGKPIPPLPLPAAEVPVSSPPSSDPIGQSPR